MDEKGLLMGVALGWKVICQKGTHWAKLPEAGSRERVTVIKSISGNGRVLCPIIVHPGKAHYMGW